MRQLQLYGILRLNPDSTMQSRRNPNQTITVVFRHVMVDLYFDFARSSLSNYKWYFYSSIYFTIYPEVKKDFCYLVLLVEMRPIFCGNFEFDARQSDLERLFGKYGKVDRVDMKSGFAFIYMDDERDAEDAIRAVDRTEFGRQGRRLRVEWTKQERGIRRPGGSRRSAANLRPTKTLFVINFDPVRTRTRDLEKHFDPYGKILNIRIRRNFAFIQFESQEDATQALDATNMSKFRDQVISVEYAARDEDDRRNGYSPGRGRDRSPERKRSLSPYRRDRGSPDYGRGPSPYSRPEPRASPDYGRAESPVYEKYCSRSPPAREKSRS
ncbi:hypothetical protein NE237_026907 [Protea cynaroides]|uniref:RRM domain-containing protein n=1 Tax=Protea cynaroides TaxID=273540 RepID=A0A9Q0JTQ2_9MAGN|nr:hypothetical protein NE237_026907 [Protea cynaroides]